MKKTTKFHINCQIFSDLFCYNFKVLIGYISQFGYSLSLVSLESFRSFLAPISYRWGC